MGEVVDISKKEQHGGGEAFCMQCGQEWHAVAPTGVTRLQCPECRAMKGLFRFEYMPSDDQLMRECSCGNDLFYLTPEGHMCANCGIYQCYE